MQKTKCENISYIGRVKTIINNDLLNTVKFFKKIILTHMNIHQSINHTIVCCHFMLTRMTRARIDGNSCERGFMVNKKLMPIVDFFYC